ncbi:MAG: hypothetical protein K2Q01_06210 [Rickettsiales bacterium]|nr:hypothetical protein [Rickettsiales bacterium]
MKKLFASLIVVFSLLVAPVAHAEEILCDGHDGSAVHQTDNTQQDNDHASKAVHHCCCTPMVDKWAAAMLHSFTASDSSAIAEEIVSLTSIVVGPLSEPPSHV